MYKYVFSKACIIVYFFRFFGDRKNISSPSINKNEQDSDSDSSSASEPDDIKTPKISLVSRLETADSNNLDEPNHCHSQELNDEKTELNASIDNDEFTSDNKNSNFKWKNLSSMFSYQNSNSPSSSYVNKSFNSPLINKNSINSQDLSDTLESSQNSKQDSIVSNPNCSIDMDSFGLSQLSEENNLDDINSNKSSTGNDTNSESLRNNSIDEVSALNLI